MSKPLAALKALDRVVIQTQDKSTTFDGRHGHVALTLSGVDEVEVRLDRDGGEYSGERVMFRRHELTLEG